MKCYFGEKGFGFLGLEGGAKDVFVHATAVKAAGMPALVVGQKVYFDVKVGERGAMAVNLRGA